MLCAEKAMSLRMSKISLAAKCHTSVPLQSDPTLTRFGRNATVLAARLVATLESLRTIALAKLFNIMLDQSGLETTAGSSTPSGAIAFSKAF